ncbi:hypothetical protein FOPG_20177 [Fusarium oxysporum f. sp. conglutinans race 2 54008]|uniref:Uncharacterized protein n=1 Tax=Fusarium oxysporum f. sp. conglutinans race 2 54008 TaxID=1089457 RepID=X0HQP2_FUSOX|nr:hypothetical protein FOPG_20177 [Fusarium oxysporum f. sp. conglutinans race 2 54008]
MLVDVSAPVNLIPKETSREILFKMAVTTPARLDGYTGVTQAATSREDVP